MFTIFPANGVVLPKGAAQITVDMYSEAPTNSEEVGNLVSFCEVHLTIALIATTVKNSYLSY